MTTNMHLMPLATFGEWDEVFEGQYRPFDPKTGKRVRAGYANKVKKLMIMLMKTSQDREADFCKKGFTVVVPAEKAYRQHLLESWTLDRAKRKADIAWATKEGNKERVREIYADTSTFGQIAATWPKPDPVLEGKVP